MRQTVSSQSSSHRDPLMADSQPLCSTLLIKTHGQSWRSCHGFGCITGHALTFRLYSLHCDNTRPRCREQASMQQSCVSGAECCACTHARTHANEHNTCDDYGIQPHLTSSSIKSRLFKWQRRKQQQRKHFLVKEQSKNTGLSLAINLNMHGKSSEVKFICVIHQ